MTPIKAIGRVTADFRSLTQVTKRGSSMSMIDIAYLALVLFAFGGFAVALAYYTHR